LLYLISNEVQGQMKADVDTLRSVFKTFR